MVACHQGQRRMVIDVRDLGSGIAEDRKELIFSPFFTTKKEGTGLGLPIVKKIAEAHDGSLEILDNSDRGVTFRLILPFPQK
jgi:two-component system sporulation sensor kinase A